MRRTSRGPDYSLGGYLFLLPNLTGFLLFVLLPVIASLALSFCAWHIFNDPEPRFNGIDNFAKLMHDRQFWYYSYNTVFMMLGIPVGMALSLALALLLNKGIRSIRFFRMIYFLPTVSSGVAVLVLWLVIYNPQYGLFNFVLAQFGIDGPDWLSGGIIVKWLSKFGIDPMCYWSKVALMIMGLWNGAGGYNMILYLAGLQGINPELYEAADVDGARAWSKFKHITWPMLSPTTFFIFIMSIIGGFQGGFEAAYVMTDGGPAGSTMTISYQIFDELYVKSQAGYASSIAWFLFAVVFILTMASWRYGGKVVHYE
jgi:multiple sugar transport system permease protein